MSNHKYTPTTEEIRKSYIGEPTHFMDQLVGAEFDRWHASELAAAEQRGAERALRDAAQVMQDDLAWANTHRGLLVFEHESDPGKSPFQWLRSRADRMEGDDD